jgi:hypothetical protein
MKALWLACLVLPLLPAPAAAQSGEELLSSSRAEAGQLIQELGAELRKQLAAGGPESAIAVCRDVAPRIAGRLSRQSGARVARVSLKTRNALLGTPDAWEQRVLEEFDRRAAAGERADGLEHSETVVEPQGRYFRYMKAIPVQSLCLTCHGSPETISPGVAQRLDEEYPHDRARGYAVGQIRGAVTVKRPLF